MPSRNLPRKTGSLEGLLILLLALLLSTVSIAQKELPLLTEKPGTFEFLSRTDYTRPECGFSKTEIADQLKEFSALVNAVRKNPVLAENKGFDARARIYNINCTDLGAYGIQARISFEFISWYQTKDGKPACITVEPPEWTVIVNRQRPASWPLAAPEFSGDKNYFILPTKMETIRRGVDLYDGEVYVLYNPDRPPYWLPVTVNEAYAKLRSYWGSQPDKFTVDFMMKAIETEYAAIPEADRNKPAYYGGTEGTIGVTANSSYSPIYRVNPAYWNKALPRSAIQFMYFRIISNRKFLKDRTAESLQNNSISYNLYRFEESLDIHTVLALLPLIR